MGRYLNNADGTPMVFNGQKCYQVDRLADLFRIGIPELDAGLDQMFGSYEVTEEVRKSVYIIGFSDETTKVGISKNPESRIRVIEKQSGREVSEYRITDTLSFTKALEIEALLKRVLAPYQLKGEFFNVPFKKVSGLLEYYERGE